MFGGAGWVLFHKPPGNDFEVYNDFNTDLVTLFRCVRDQPEELISELRYALNSRADFDRTKQMLLVVDDLPDIKKAALFYQLVRYSYASDRESFGCRPYDIWSGFPVIQQAHRRLRKTVIENKDFEKLIRQYDRQMSFFYCDPPYYQTENYYEGFSRQDHQRLHDCLTSIQGRFLLSYNDCEFIRHLYSEPNIQLFEVSRLDSIKQRYDAGAQYAELLIANYDMSERALYLPKQLTLYDSQILI